MSEFCKSVVIVQWATGCDKKDGYRASMAVRQRRVVLRLTTAKQLTPTKGPSRGSCTTANAGYGKLALNECS